MFFSDNGPNPRIEKASLDGQDREVIVYSGLSRVFSLSVDILNDKLYWVDKTRHTVEVSNYDGTNRRVIRRMNGVQLTDLFFHQVRSVSRKRIQFKQRYRSSFIHSLWGISIFNIQYTLSNDPRYIIPNDCKMNLRCAQRYY